MSNDQLMSRKESSDFVNQISRKQYSKAEDSLDFLALFSGMDILKVLFLLGAKGVQDLEDNEMLNYLRNFNTFSTYMLFLKEKYDSE